MGHPIEQKIGTPQGDKLSPLLFAYFIADLARILEATGCSIIFYADDLAIGSDSIEGIQKAFGALEKYCEENGLLVNIGKTKVVKFRNGGRLAAEDKVTYKGVAIEFVECFEYLGIKLSSRLRPAAHLEHRRKKANQAIARLQTMSPMRKMNFLSAGRLFNAIIVPSLMYGIEVFSDVTPETISELIKKLAGLFYKKWMGISIYASTSNTLQELFYNDFLKVQNCRPHQRRERGIYYDNGYHHKLCHKAGCYRIEKHDLSMLTGFTRCILCRCKYCMMPLDNHHICTCPRFSHLESLESKIKCIYTLPS